MKMYMYRVFQKKLHRVCRVINFEPLVLGFWCLRQNLLLTDRLNYVLVGKYSLLIGWK